MKVEFVTKEEALSRAAELLSLPLYRPTHRVCNFFDAKNNKVIVTEFHDFLSTKKEEFRSMCSRQIGTITDNDDLRQFLPDDVDLTLPVRAWAVTGLYIIAVGDRYFAVGHRFENDKAMESRLDGMAYLGEVSASGEFRFVYIPRVGMCLRCLAAHELNGSGQYSPFNAFGGMRNDEGRSYNSYTSMIVLVNDDLTVEFNAFDEDADGLRKFLEVPDTLNEEYSWRLRNWTYPRFWEEESSGPHHMRWRTNSPVLDRSNQCVNINSPVLDVTFKVGTGNVEVKLRNDRVRKENCVPGLEYAYAETFYV